MAFVASPPSALPGISPSRGEIGRGSRSPISYAQFSRRDIPSMQEARLLSISPLEGEMSGRTEGGQAKRATLTTAKIRRPAYYIPPVAH
jgi:diaminohydroxyphosphoribosylaminopyrimidine deaminase / 5-amino-6-(5-phosphoribosylamino)uracil reductase